MRQGTTTSHAERRGRIPYLFALALGVMLALGLLPGTLAPAYADTAYNEYLVTTEANNDKTGEDLTALQVTFNGLKWYVIEDGSDEDSATVTLLAADVLKNERGTTIYRQFGDNNKYSESDVKNYLDGLTEAGGSFAGVADAIKTVKVKGSESDNEVEAKLWLLSTQEAKDLPRAVREAGDLWWLRSPGIGDNRAAFGGSDGSVDVQGLPVDGRHGVRPALKLKLESVIFKSDTKTFELPSAPSTTHGTTTRPNKAERVSGADRYATMAALVPKAFPSSSGAVVASGASFADALSAAALAGAKGCPVVLTDPAALPAASDGALSGLGATDVTVVGGPEAVSDGVAAQLGASRVSGEDRYATAVESMRAVRATAPSSDTVVVATGSEFADALSAGPWAWRSKSPILLALPDGTLPQDAADAVLSDPGIRRVILVGGHSAVSDAVKEQLGDGHEYVRLGGADRYATSAGVAEWAAENGLGWSRPVVATGRDFADALSAAAVCGAKRSVLLLADSADASTISLLRQNRSKVVRAYVAGGTSAVSSAVESAVRNALR